MKISKRLLISNVSISLITMILLALILSSIITNHFEKEVRKDLESLNDNVISFMGFKRFFNIEEEKLSLDHEVLKKFAFRFEDINYAVQLTSDVTSNEFVNNTFYEKQLDFEAEKYGEIYKEKIGGVEHLFLANHIVIDFDNVDYDVIVLAFVKNDESQLVVNQINYTLIGAIIVIGLLSFLVTHYHDKKLLEPVNQLVEATEAIGRKKFETQLNIHTGDEFEKISIAINQMSNRLKTLDREQREFYENISHEVKTPLAVISGYAQSIQNNLIEDPGHALETMVSECDRLKHLLEDFIFLSKLESVEEAYHMKSQNLNDVVGDVLNHYENLLLISGIDIIFEPKGVLSHEIDESKMYRAISNIIGNCLRYAEHTITVETYRDESVHVIIKDDGKGFDKTILEDPFTRSRFNDAGGNGIGLSIISKVVEDHGGRVELSNEHGAIYHIIL